MDMYLLQAFCWKRTELFEGYEPNVAPIAMEGTSKRSSSVPADSSGLVTGGNPFYSQKVQQEFRLQAARPSNLPSPSDSNLEPLTGGQKSGGNPMVENPTGKGRGSSNYEVRQGLSFETPPSKLPPPPTEGKSAAMMSEGVMKEPESALKSMGPVKGVADSSVPGMGEDQLQRALEGELVSFLREQNSKLMNDLEEMKQRLAGLENSKGDSSMSWSEVGAPSMGSLDEQPRARRRRGSRTPPRGKSPMVCKESMSPRRARSMGLDVDQSCLRCTPNGTKVPEGPPPPCDDVSTGLPQPPPVPPFPVGIEGPRNGEFSPRAARAMWLEREAHCMKGVLDRQAEGNPIKESMYWTGSFQYPFGRDHAKADVVGESLRQQARAFMHGEGALHDRAFMHGSGVHQDRVSVHGEGALHDRASMHGTGALHDRASMHGTGAQHDRAFMHGDGALHDRASMHGTGCQHDRAFMHGDVCHQDRASRDGLFLQPGSPLWYPDGKGQGQDPKCDGSGWHDNGIVSSLSGPNPIGKVELPDLPEGATPLEYGDWLHLCGPTMRDLSNVAGRWWELTTREAKAYYMRWKDATPLQRVQIVPKLPDELLLPSYVRTEQRGVHLLLKAVSQEQQQELVIDRDLTSTAILYRLYIRHQPGGPGEKAVLLKALTTLGSTKTLNDMASSLRSWRRHFGRAREIGAVLPDGCLLLKALEGIVGPLSQLDAQSSFRLAQSRVQLQLDEKPTHGALWDFSQCLLAEVETLVLMAPTSTTNSQVKIKQMDASNATPTAKPGEFEKKGKGFSNAGSIDKPCKYYVSPEGCRAGRSCKFQHVSQDQNDRCWVCGSTQHRKVDCPVRGGAKQSSPTKPTSETNAGSGGGKGKGGGKKSDGSASTGNTSNAGAKTSSTSITEDKIAGSQPEKDPQQKTTSEATVKDEKSSGGVAMSAAKTGASDLLLEATNLLKSMRIPNMKVMKITNLKHDDRDQWILLDSGATHGLRQAHSQEEWLAAQETEVTLAEGVTKSLKLKVGTKLLLAHPDSPTSWIVPMSGLSELGYRFEWHGENCKLYNSEGAAVEIRLRHGCPMVPKSIGKGILEEMELKQLRLLKRAIILKALWHGVEVDEENLNVESALLLKLKEVFPDLPEELMMKLIPDMNIMTKEGYGNLLPWNRAKRKRLLRAEKVVLHICSGPEHRFWERQLNTDKVETLCIDLEGPVKADILNDAVFSYLIALAASGRLKTILAGPPCRTCSALRFKDDNGPGIIRTEEHPYGCPGISEKDFELVQNDSLIFLRTLALYVIAEEVRPHHEPQTGFGLEQPEDPANYRPEKEVKEVGFMSMWRTPEWKGFASKFNIKLISFDQGPMGHSKRKPTSMGVALPQAQQLHELRGPPSD